MPKIWFLLVSAFMAASLVITPPIDSAELGRDFKRANGLQAYAPPEWFLKAGFIACEKNPGYVFGPVRAFVETLGATTAWLIEDMELERLEAAAADGKQIEFSLFLEALFTDRTEYWVFVALPYETPQAWYEARRAYHGRKAEQYYGKTLSELERALGQGLTINAELRFWVDNGAISLQTPEEVIMRKYKFQPVFDLGAGRRPD